MRIACAVRTHPDNPVYIMYSTTNTNGKRSSFNAFKWYSLSSTDASVFDKLMPCTKYLPVKYLTTDQPFHTFYKTTLIFTFVI